MLDAKDALFRVKHQPETTKILERLLDVDEKVGFCPGLDDDIVDVGLGIATDLGVQAALNAALVSRPGVLEAEGHLRVAVGSKRRDEGRVDLVLLT